MLDRMAGSGLEALLAKPLSCRRAGGVVARSEWFEEATTRRRHEELGGAARSLDAAAFRARYRLP